MWIKICANTNLADAQLAASLGADALGFVFAASKRQVSVEQVARITEHLPASVERIGVFDTQTGPEIVRAVREATLTGVQLHGRLDAHLVEMLAAELGASVDLIQTISWAVDRDEQDTENEVARQLGEVEALPAIGRVLIDSRVGSIRGGSGVPFRWSDAARVLTACLGRAKGRAELIVAGGLRPENVTEAMQTLTPWGVDVATGVESTPGQKDAKKLREFLLRARAPDVTRGDGSES